MDKNLEILEYLHRNDKEVIILQKRRKYYNTNKEKITKRIREHLDIHPEIRIKKSYKACLKNQLKNPSCTFGANGYCCHEGCKNYPNKSSVKHSVCRYSKFRPNCPWFKSIWPGLKIIRGENESETKVVVQEEPIEPNTDFQ